MKNAALIILFLAFIFGGGYWLTSETESNDSTSFVGGNKIPETGPASDPAKPAPPPATPEVRPEPSEKGPWPKVVAEEREFKFGRMVVGSKRDHVFIIRNEGEADLELLEGEPTCKCTVFQLNSRTVPPGESAELKVQWHGKFKDPNFQHGGRIYTNDPNSKELGIRVVGIVDTAFDVMPADTWNLPAVTTDGKSSMEGYVLSRVFDDFEVTSVECNSPYFEASVAKLTPEQIDEIAVREGVLSGYTVAVSVVPDIPPGLAEATLELQTNKADEAMTIDLRARKEGPIRIVPMPGMTWSAEKNGLGLGRFRADKGRKASLILMVDHTEFDETLEFTSVDCDPGFVKVELDSSKATSGTKRRYQLNIEIPPGIPAMTRTRDEPARVNIQTNHPSGQSIDIKLAFGAFN